MSERSIQQTAVNLDGLLEILGKNLYSSPTVALRELIQNASDACERHRLESDEVKSYEIRLTCLPESGELIISDNGSGLTRDEIHEFLATIGSGYSRLLRQQTGTSDVIGYFGLGFLSAYVVSSKVEVTSCSYKTPDECWKFLSAGGKSYSVSPAETQAVGTRVKLKLADGFYQLANASYVSSLVELYCCLLDTPIYIDGGSEPLNNLLPPWRDDPDAPTIRKRKLALEFASVFESAFEPIAVFQLPADNPVGLNGLIWLQGGSSYATSDNRNMSVFIRNMFITDEDKDLLPRWAGFVGGVIVSDQFLPTASRESLQKDAYYRDVVDYLHQFLASELRRLVLEDPAAWRRVLTRHSQALLGAAISDDRLFETSCQSLRVPTSEGDMTVPDILARSDNQLYIKPSSQTGHEEILFRARGVPLVKGYLYGATGFCQKYGTLKGVPVETLGSSTSRDSVFPVVDAEPPELATLLRDLFETVKHEVRFTSFSPEHIPLITMEDADIVTKKRIEDDEADQRISTAALSLARLHTKSETRIRERMIFINLSNPVIQALPELDTPSRKNIQSMLLSLMELLCLDTSQLDHGLDTVFETFNTAILTLYAGKGH